VAFGHIQFQKSEQQSIRIKELQSELDSKKLELLEVKKITDLTRDEAMRQRQLAEENMKLAFIEVKKQRAHQNME
jgi:hypothetical protein